MQCIAIKDNNKPEQARTLVIRLRRSKVCLIEQDWDRVDAMRAWLETHGLTDRFTVHHARALPLLHSSSAA